MCVRARHVYPCAVQPSESEHCDCVGIALCSSPSDREFSTHQNSAIGKTFCFTSMKSEVARTRRSHWSGVGPCAVSVLSASTDQEKQPAFIDCNHELPRYCYYYGPYDKHRLRMANWRSQSAPRQLPYIRLEELGRCASSQRRCVCARRVSPMRMLFACKHLLSSTLPSLKAQWPSRETRKQRQICQQSTKRNGRHVQVALQFVCDMTTNFRQRRGR